MVEEERKYQVPPGFRLPDLDSCLPSGGRLVELTPVTLRTTYYDTADRRLARAGLSLRHRDGETAVDGEARPWTVKLPTGAVGVREEVSLPGPASAVPATLVDLLTAYHRGAGLTEAAVLHTVRRAYELCDGTGRVLAEIADDTVRVLDGDRTALAFREIEVERRNGGSKLLDKVGKVLCRAGAAVEGFTPKHVRAMGEPATRPPDLAPPQALPDHPRAADVVTAAIRRDVARILGNDPWVRLERPLPDGDTPVHQMRVGCRRLRSDLRTFAPVLDRRWARRLRSDLSTLTGQLGAARDAEVLRVRLRRTAAADPVAPLDESAVSRIDAGLVVQQRQALDVLARTLGSDGYQALVDSLLDAAGTPRLTSAAGGPAGEVLPRLVEKPWRTLEGGGRGAPGAGHLAAQGPDDDWHAVRANGKRARYAAEAVADALDGARELATVLAVAQDLLGEHQDAALAAEAWLRAARRDPADHALAVTAGRLFEREREAVRRVRAAFPPVWQVASRLRLSARSSP